MVSQLSALIFPSFPQPNPPSQMVPLESSPRPLVVQGWVRDGNSVNSSVTGSKLATFPRQSSANQILSVGSTRIPWGEELGVGTPQTAQKNTLLTYFPSQIHQPPESNFVLGFINTERFADGPCEAEESRRWGCSVGCLEPVSLNLSGRGSRKLADKSKASWYFEMGEAVPNLRL